MCFAESFEVGENERTADLQTVGDQYEGDTRGIFCLYTTLKEIECVKTIFEMLILNHGVYTDGKVYTFLIQLLFFIYAVMVMVSIAFIALVICLVVICTGAVCLKRFVDLLHWYSLLIRN